MSKVDELTHKIFGEWFTDVLMKHNKDWNELLCLARVGELQETIAETNKCVNDRILKSFRESRE